jgi:exopolysaccharide biosynthesis predicted pyruvyltransferase EpsI
VITDRYHGTIFALAAGTPVVIIRTIDHKVITGADWFKGVYDDYVYMAQDLDDAFQIVSSIRKKNLNHCLQLVFATEYYDKLKSIFESGKK